MKEEDLIKLGFNRTDVSKEEAGDEAFHYYDYDFGNSSVVSLISSDNHQAEKDGYWTVEVFEDDSINYDNYEDVLDFITIIKKGVVR
jgi:hypothetical protein